MLDRGSGPKNKVELESQVLCAALRQSWASRDSKGAVTSARELYQLFPDLLPPPKLGSEHHPVSYYEMLGVKQQASGNLVVASFLREAKKFLRTGKVKDRKEAYFKILDAGFV